MQGDDWRLISAEERAAKHPDTFQTPSHAEREGLKAGDAVKLLFDVGTKEDRGVHRMWVIVIGRVGNVYTGFLDSDPGVSDLSLRERDVVAFGPEHVANIDHPPRDYIKRKYGEAYFPD